MTLGRAVDEALSPEGKTGKVEAESGGRTAELDVRDADRLGVRLRRLRVQRGEAPDPEEEAERLPERLRALPERLEPTEVDRGLGGAVFRTAPDEVEDGEYYELELRGRQLDLQRHRAVRGGPRTSADFTLSREQLRRLVDGMGDDQGAR